MPEIKQYKCPSCGGALEFDSKLQKLKCPFCDSEFEIETLNEVLDAKSKVEVEDSMSGWQAATESSWSSSDGVSSYICNSCGGEILADENTGATVCPFCGNNVVIREKFSEALKPDLIVPFKLDKKAAKEAFLSHLSGKKLLPKAFRQQTHIDEIKGLYVPFWLYHADVDGAVKYSATKIRHWSTSQYDYTETKFYDIYREGGVSFHDIPVDASSKMPDDLMDSLEPFRFEEAVDFNTAYFAGFLADKYDVTVEDNIPRINTRVKKSTEEAFERTVTELYDTLTVDDSYIHLKNGKATYALLPVWLLNTSWNGGNYVFAMNGQTGKFVGDLPMDKKLYFKYWLLAFSCSIPIGLIVSWLVHFLIG